MYMCLGISQGVQIRTADREVDRGILDKYNAGKISEIPRAALPSAFPMFLDFGPVVRSSWNEAVCRKYLAWLSEREQPLRNREIPLPDTEKREEMFFNKVATLRRYLYDLQPREFADGTMESERQVQERVRRADEQKRDEARRNTRRHTVRSEAQGLCYALLTNVHDSAVLYEVGHRFIQCLQARRYFEI